MCYAIKHRAAGIRERQGENLPDPPAQQLAQGLAGELRRAFIEEEELAFAVKNGQRIRKLGCGRSEALPGCDQLAAPRQLTLNGPANQEENQSCRRGDEQQSLEQVGSQMRQ